MRDMIIGVTGKSESGKSTIGMFLQAAFGLWSVPIGDGLRSALRSLDGPGWDISKNIAAGNVRTHMQRMGTECGRDVHKNVWTNLFDAKLAYVHDVVKTTNVVVPDVRFHNEELCLRSAAKLYGVPFALIRVERPNHLNVMDGSQRGHRSEGGEGLTLQHDVVIQNDADRLTLCVRVNNWVCAFIEQQEQIRLLGEENRPEIDASGNIIPAKNSRPNGLGDVTDIEIQDNETLDSPPSA